MIASPIAPTIGRVTRLLARLVRYGAVSVVATVVGLSTLAALVGWAGLPAGWSNVIATVVGTVPSFELNRRWVWSQPGRPSIHRQMVPYLLFAFVELLVSTAIVHTANSWALGHGWGRSTRTGVVELANVTAYGGLWIVQFVLLDRVLFRRPPADGLGDPGPMGDHGPAGCPGPTGEPTLPDDQIRTGSTATRSRPGGRGLPARASARRSGEAALTSH